MVTRKYRQLYKGNCTQYHDLQKIEVDEENVNTKYLKINVNPTKTEYENFICGCDTNAKYMASLVTNPINTPYLYNACAKNNFSAVRRLLANYVKPDQEILKKFKIYVQKIIKQEIRPMLHDFDYDHVKWFNHLTLAKQEEVITYFNHKENRKYDRMTIPDKVSSEYTNFVKTEKQAFKDKCNSVICKCEKPKTRCICSPNAYLKYVMGPVCLQLEAIFKNNFKSYKVPKTYGETEQELDKLEAQGYKYTLQSDGKGFDNTQYQEIKDIVDKEIYKIILNNIHHVPKEHFEQAVLQADWRTIIIKYIEGKEMKSIGKVKIRGKTFSGSMDTTLMNTIRMGLYHRYFIEEYLKITEYEIWVKGDDLVIFFKELPKDLENKYFQLFLKYGEKQTIHGLGQIAKFLKIGDFEDFDFCSTHAFKTDAGYKITRQFDKIFDNDVWSRKAAFKNNGEVNEIMAAIELGASKWTKGSKLMSTFYRALKERNTDPTVKSQTKIGKNKLYFKEERETPYMFHNIQEQYWEDIKNIERTSDRIFSDIDYDIWLIKKHNITILDLWIKMIDLGLFDHQQNDNIGIKIKD
jgi:hypothetical protein